MKKTIRFQRFIEKKEEGSYLSVPFSVPADIESMTVSYSYSRENNIVDFGLSGAGEEFIGWSGSDRTSITISQEKSSRGFACVSPEKGTWNVLLGCYKIQEEGVMVNLEGEFTMKALRMLKGDTHVHSLGSDGNMSQEELGALAEREGLDYLFITDHNNYAHNYSLPKDGQVRILSGTEWTTYKGHSGMLGVQRPFHSFIANSENEVKEIFSKAAEKGALIVLNHPFCPDCGWKWGMDTVPWNLIEIWNGGLTREANELCVRWWDAQLRQGRRIAGVGGSDFHRLEPGRVPAAPCTCIFSRSKEKEDILYALKEGHSFITQSPYGPFMEIADENQMPGTVQEKDSWIHWKFTELHKGDVLCLIGNHGTEKLVSTGSEIEVTWKAEQPGFLRAEIRRMTGHCQEGIPVLFTNPYYIE